MAAEKRQPRRARVRKGKFVKIGKVSVSGRRVKKEMVVHRTIKGYEPVEIAERIVTRRFPKAEYIILTEIRCHKR